jgi:hypothetical protein
VTRSIYEVRGELAELQERFLEARAGTSVVSLKVLESAERELLAELYQLEVLHGDGECNRTQRYQCGICWRHVCWCKGAADDCDRAMQVLGFDGVCDDCFADVGADIEDGGGWRDVAVEAGMRSELKVRIAGLSLDGQHAALLAELVSSHAQVVELLDGLLRFGGLQ